MKNDGEQKAVIELTVARQYIEKCALIKALMYRYVCVKRFQEKDIRMDSEE